MIEFILYIIFLFGGLLFGSWWFTVTILPIFYGFPKAIILWRQKKLGIQAAFSCLSTALIWNLIFLLIGLALLSFAKEFAQVLLNSGSFFTGQSVGVVFMLIRGVTPAGRQDLRKDFVDKTAKWNTAV